jgi:hypothetical protein
VQDRFTRGRRPAQVKVMLHVKDGTGSALAAAAADDDDMWHSSRPAEILTCYSNGILPSRRRAQADNGRCKHARVRSQSHGARSEAQLS